MKRELSRSRLLGIKFCCIYFCVVAFLSFILYIFSINFLFCFRVAQFFHFFFHLYQSPSYHCNFLAQTFTFGRTNLSVSVAPGQSHTNVYLNGDAAGSSRSTSSTVKAHPSEHSVSRSVWRISVFMRCYPPAGLAAAAAHMCCSNIWPAVVRTRHQSLLASADSL